MNFHLNLDICGKSFTRNRDMVAHKKKLHLMPTAPIPQIASTTHISSSFGMLSHTHHQGTISMIHSHTQRLHPY